MALLVATTTSAPTEAGRRERPRLRWILAILGALAVLGALSYLPFLNLPLIADDYVQIKLARKYGPVSGWAGLASDPLYHCRATSLILTYWTERLWGISPLAFNWSSVLLHILNTWLVFALGAWRRIGWRISAAAAAFFAVYEGHQEAVIWYSALPELLVFFFTLLCLLCWILWLRPASCGYYVAAVVSFLLALASKESAVAIVPLLLLVLGVERPDWRRVLLWVAPFAGAAGVYAGLIFAGRAQHLHFHDGTFSLQAPFAFTWLNSVGRLLWLWGLLGLLALWMWRPRRVGRLEGLAFAWITITLLPYCFLTYMSRVPSRHTYLASTGLALVVAAGFLALRDWLAGPRRWATGLIAALILAHNWAYLWTRKHAQYMERAAPTEALIDLARRAQGPVYVHCFPYSRVIAAWAIELGAGKPDQILVWDRRPAKNQTAAVVFCWEAQRSTQKYKGASYWIW